MPTVAVLNTSAGLKNKQVLTSADTATVAGLKTFSRAPVAPFGVQASSTHVPELDSDLVDGMNASDIIAAFQPIPTGAMIMHGGSAAPSGWLLCDGSAVSRTTYAALFALIGTTYGVGDGSTTFNVPDCRQRLPLGVAASGTGSALAQTGGAIDHAHNYSQVLNHSHPVNVTDPGHDHTTNQIPLHSINAPFAGGGTNLVLSGNLVSPGTATTGISMTTANPAGGVSSGTTAGQNPPFCAVNFIIRT